MTRIKIRELIEEKAVEHLNGFFRYDDVELSSNAMEAVNEFADEITDEIFDGLSKYIRDEINYIFDVKLLK